MFRLGAFSRSIPPASVASTMQSKRLAFGTKTYRGCLHLTILSGVPPLASRRPSDLYFEPQRIYYLRTAHLPPLTGCRIIAFFWMNFSTKLLLNHRLPIEKIAKVPLRAREYQAWPHPVPLMASLRGKIFFLINRQFAEAGLFLTMQVSFLRRFFLYRWEFSCISGQLHSK